MMILANSVIKLNDSLTTGDDACKSVRTINIHMKYYVLESFLFLNDLIYEFQTSTFVFVSRSKTAKSSEKVPQHL